MMIKNIVYSGRLNQNINLYELFKLDNSIYSYNPKIYPGAYIKLSKGKVTLYRSGKYIIVGLSNLKIIGSVFNELLNLLSPYIDIDKVEFPTLQNIVAIDDLDRKINLNNLALTLKLESYEFEPEVFPGLILRDESCTALIFSTGKIVIVGAKNTRDIGFLLDKVKKIIG